MNNQCFICEEKKDITLLDKWSVYSKQKQELIVCMECTDQLGELKYFDIDWTTYTGKCSICEREIKVIPWTKDMTNGVYVDILGMHSKNTYNYYRICRSCYERDIALEIESGS